jgi:hypothetical protein
MAAQSADFAEQIAELTGILLGTGSVDDFLLDLAVLAARELGEDLSCGIILQPRDRLLTVASSDVTAAQVDEVQYSLYQGPCLHSIRTGELVRIDDLVFDRRWWEYAVRALARGVRSSLRQPPADFLLLLLGRGGDPNSDLTSPADQPVGLGIRDQREPDPPFGAVAGWSSRRSETVQIRLICVRLRRSLAPADRRLILLDVSAF